MRSVIIGVAVSMVLVGCRSDAAAGLTGCADVSMVAADCRNDGAAGSYDEASVITHQQSWQSQGIHSYSFDLAQQQLGRVDSVHIVVESDAVVSVIDQHTGLSRDNGATWYTIDGLFDFAKQVIETDHATYFDVEYDPQYGYISVLSEHGFDPGGGYTAHVYNFVPAN
jgi:uncharacterized protein DUF6174